MLASKHGWQIRSSWKPTDRGNYGARNPIFRHTTRRTYAGTDAVRCSQMRLELFAGRPAGWSACQPATLLDRLSLCLSVYISVYRSVGVSVYLSAGPVRRPATRGPRIHPLACLPVCLSACAQTGVRASQPASQPTSMPLPQFTDRVFSGVVVPHCTSS